MIDEEPTVVVENIEDTLTFNDAAGERSSLVTSLRSCSSIRDLKNWERDNDGEIAWVEENDAKAFDEIKVAHAQVEERVNG